MENKKIRKNRVFETEKLHYSYCTKNWYNVKIMRVSRWIRINTICITKKSKFWELADSYIEYGGIRTIEVFRHKDRLYPICNFLRFDYPLFFKENGEKNYISGYDGTDYYYPLLVEVSSNGEYVRLYRELKENEYKENGGMY